MQASESKYSLVVLLDLFIQYCSVASRVQQCNSFVGTNMSSAKLV